jgi:hypothetical protein
MENLIQLKSGVDFWASRDQNACPLCEGIGFQLIEMQGQTMARKCRCISAERICNLQSRSGLPEASWGESLHAFAPRSFEEIQLVDFLGEYLEKKDLPLLQLWITPSEKTDPVAVLRAFANELIRTLGYSCLWLDCAELAQRPARTNPARLSRFDHTLVHGGDFLFLVNYRQGLLKSKLQGWLEEALAERMKNRKSVVFIGPRPEGFVGHQQLFVNPNLGVSLLRKFRAVEPGKGEQLPPHTGWLF